MASMFKTYSDYVSGNTSNFNQDISKWDTSKVTDMTTMFERAEKFNQDISKWDTSSVTNMLGMFANAKVFNQNLNSWVVSETTDVAYMFSGATAFKQSLKDWNLAQITAPDNYDDMFSNTALAEDTAENKAIWQEMKAQPGWSGKSASDLGLPAAWDNE